MDGNRVPTRSHVVTFPPPVTLGVVADTHVHDRYPSLPSDVLQVFDRARVQAILHAGDVTHPRVLHQLAEVAPVYAVRGNRDFLLGLRLPPVQEFQIGPYRVALVHGHGSFWRYVVDKMAFLVGRPLTFRTLENRAHAWFPHAQVVIMGHTHVPVLRRREGRWVFNPGSPTVPPSLTNRIPRTVGLLHVSPEGALKFEFVLLGGRP